MATKKKEQAAKKKFAALEKKMQNPKYSNQAYKNDAEVVISGELFADFVNTRGNTENTLLQVKRHLESAVRVIDHLLAENDALTLRLMEQHVKNVDNGSTYTVEQPVQAEQEVPQTQVDGKGLDQ